MILYQGTWRDDWNGSKVEIKYLHDKFLKCTWKDWESDSRSILEADIWELKWTNQPTTKGYYCNRTITWNNGRKWDACTKVEPPSGNKKTSFPFYTFLH